jgi:hypothetical protein
VCPKDGPEILEKRKSLAPCLDSNPGPSSLQLVATLAALSRLRASYQAWYFVQRKCHVICVGIVRRWIIPRAFLRLDRPSSEANRNDCSNSKIHTCSFAVFLRHIAQAWTRLQRDSGLELNRTSVICMLLSKLATSST